MPPVRAGQLSLFGGEAPAIDERFSTCARTHLDTDAWYERAPGWIAGHERLFEELLASIRWQSTRREMYDRTVDVPRLLASLPEDGPAHPLIERMRVVLSRRYGEAFTRVTLALYRDGNDSVAFHGDTTARELDQALVATVSLGEPRKFLLRPRVVEGHEPPARRSLALRLGWGDLLVMGGACQRTWEHAIPKVAHAGPRLAIMFRPSWYR